MVNKITIVKFIFTNTEAKYYKKEMPAVEVVVLSLSLCVIVNIPLRCYLLPSHTLN